MSIVRKIVSRFAGQSPSSGSSSARLNVVAASGPYGQSGWEAARLYTRDWQMSHGRVGWEEEELTWSDRGRLITQLYQLLRRFPLVQSPADKFSRYVIGAGPWPRIKTSSAEFNEALHNAFKRHFSNPVLCDIRRQDDLPTMLKTAFNQAYYFSGDCGLRIHTGNGVGMFRLEPYESDRIGPPADFTPPANEKMGIQIERWGEYRAFRVGQRGPGGLVNTRLVPASDFIFAARHLPQRFDQVRGVGVLAQAFDRFIKSNEITNSELVALSNASKLAFYQPIEGLDDVELPTDANGNPVPIKIKLEDGTVIMGPAGSKPEAIKMERPNPELIDFIDSIFHEIAAVLGISFYQLTGKSLKNFSQNKGDLKSDAESFEEMQRWVRREFQLDRIVWRFAIEFRNELPPAPPDWKFANLYELIRYTWPKLNYFDPEKQAKADRLKMENGGSLYDIYGDEWKDHVDRAFEVQQYIAKKEEETGIDRDRVLRPISASQDILKKDDDIEEVEEGEERNQVNED